MDLETIGQKYGTDKADFDGGHGYTYIYDNLFKRFRDKSFNLLEIGVFFGASIKMWSEYFQKATIFGIDTFEGHQGNGSRFDCADKYYQEWKAAPPNNIELMKVDQSSINDLKNFTEHCKKNNIKFKIILDDGSHLMYDQQISFFYLHELLEENGIYIIEDIHTSDAPDYDVKEDLSNSTKKLFRNIENGENFKSIYINDIVKCNTITRKIKRLDFKTSVRGGQTLIIYF